MKVNSINRSTFLLASFVLALTSGAATSAQTPYRPGVGFAMIGISAGQSARVNALNAGSGSSAQDSSCRVTLQFLDMQGQVLKQTDVTLRPGRSAFMDLSRDAVRANDRRVEIRAVLLFGYFGGPPPSPELLHQFDCEIVPSLEIYDNSTGRTSLVLTDGKPLPPPAIPVQ